MPDSNSHGIATTTTTASFALPLIFPDWKTRMESEVRANGLSDEAAYAALFGDDEPVAKNPEVAVKTMAAAINWVASEHGLISDVLRAWVDADQPSVEQAARDLHRELQEQMEAFARDWGVEPPQIDPIPAIGEDFQHGPDCPEHGEFWGATW